MLIKALREVTTAKEKQTIHDVRWGRVSAKGTSGFSQRGAITGMWKLGCSLTTRNNLRAGENIWIRAKDDLGRVIFSLVGIVTWNENTFQLDGYRCEVRFREDPSIGLLFYALDDVKTEWAAGSVSILK